MYVPSEFRAVDPLAVIAEHPFAMLVALPSGHAAHVPLVLAMRDGEQVLIGHVARASPLAEVIEAGSELLAIFRGPHAYISPFDYDPAGRDPGKQVPTWNYVASHVKGRPRVFDPTQAREALAQLASRFDARGWTDQVLPDGYREGLVRAIVAFELPLDDVIGKDKLGQNRTSTQRLAAADALERREDPTDRDVGRLMRQVR